MSEALVSPVFVGRRDELARMADALARVRSDREASFVVVAGEAGVGKSRLVAEVARGAASDGWRVLLGRCVELGAEGLPFAPFVGALRALVRSTPLSDLGEVLGTARAGVARLVPELRQNTSGDVVGAPAEPSQLFELLLGLFERLGREEPLLLVVEDLHWADLSTLGLLAYFIRSLRETSVLVIATFRSDELHRRHPLRPLLAEWERVRSLQRVDLERFSRSDVDGLLDAILGDASAPEFVDAVLTRSGGNAFLVEEIAAALRRGDSLEVLPASLRDVLLARADGVGAAGQRLLRAAAVAGPWVSDPLLLAVTGEADDGAFFEALRELIERHILVVDPAGQGYGFRHALARDAIYEDMLPGERIRLHARYGEVLSARPELAGDDSVVLAALAHHWYAALDLPRALSASVAAALDASTVVAPSEALRHYERALEVWSRVDAAENHSGVDLAELSRLAAQAAFLAGSVDRSLALADQALLSLGDADAADDSQRRALLLEQKATALLSAGRGSEAVPILEDALSGLTDEQSATRAVVLTSLALTLTHSAGPEAALAVAEAALAAARRAGAGEQEAAAGNSLALAQMYSGDPEMGLASLSAAIAKAEELGATQLALRGLVNLSDGLEMLGRHVEAADAARRGMALASRAGDLRTFGTFLTGNLSESLLRLGEWDEVEQLLAEALKRRPEGIFAAMLLLIRAELRLERGALDVAELDIDAARAIVGDSGDDQYLQPLAYLAAGLARSRGQLDKARAIIAGNIGGRSTWSARYTWPLVWLGLVVELDAAKLNRDRRRPVPELSLATVTQLSTLAEQLPALTPPALAYRSATVALAAQVMGSATVELLTKALEAWRATGEPHRVATTLVELAEQLCNETSAQARSSAEENLAAAVQIARRLRAMPLVRAAEALATRARLELPAESARFGTTDATGLAAAYGLTEREEQVLGLLTQGLSNPAIAAKLFISPKTVSVHLSRVFTKLSVTGRLEAAHVAHEFRIGR